MRRLALLLLALLLVPAFAGEREERIDASHVKVGQTYRWKLAAGNSAVWEVVGKDEREVRYKITCVVAGKELPGKDEVHVFPLVRKATDEKPASGEKETLRVSGIEFPCTILETESGGTTVRTWRSLRFPETVKVQLGRDVTSELVEVK